MSTALEEMGLAIVCRGGSDCLCAAWREAEAALPWDEADNMCPNCVTPWKCNGPHTIPLSGWVLKGVRRRRPRHGHMAYEGQYEAQAYRRQPPGPKAPLLAMTGLGATPAAALHALAENLAKFAEVVA